MVYAQGAPYPPPPPPKRRRWPIIVLIAVVLLLLCCGGGGYAIYRAVASASAPVRDAANGFVDDLQANRVDAAYDKLCGTTKQAYTREAFADYVGRQRKITKHQTTSFSVNSTNGQSTGSVTMRL